MRLNYKYKVEMHINSKATDIHADSERIYHLISDCQGLKQFLPEQIQDWEAATEDLYQMKELEMNHIPMDHLWVLKEGHCLRNQVIRLCEFDSGFSSIYEAAWKGLPRR